MTRQSEVSRVSSSNMATLLSLPDETLLGIFRKLPIWQIQLLRRTCTRFDTLGKDRDLYRKIIISPESECLNAWRYLPMEYTPPIKPDEDYEDVKDPYIFPFGCEKKCSCPVCRIKFEMGVTQIRSLINLGHVFSDHTKSIHLGYR